MSRGGGEGRCSYKMHSLTQDRTGRQTALGYDALNEGPAGSGGEIVWSKEVTGPKVLWHKISGNVTVHVFSVENMKKGRGQLDGV